MKHRVITHPRRAAMARGAALVAVTLGAFGCTEESSVPVGRLARPNSVALVCEGPNGGVPVEDCEKTAGNTLIGWVLNSDGASVTRVRVSAFEVIDADPFIPGESATPIGGTPESLVAAPDGSALYAVDVFAREVIRIDVATRAVTRQALGALPASLVVGSTAVYVALPDREVIAIVPTDTFGDVTTLDAIAVTGGSPYDLALSSDETELWVSHIDVAWVSLIDIATSAEVRRVAIGPACRNDLDDNGDGLIDSADGGCRFSPNGPEDAIAAPPAPASWPDEGRPACFDEVDDDGDGATDYPADPDCLSAAQDSETRSNVPVLSRIALSPDGVFLYATNARERSVEVVDASTASRIDVNADGAPGANALYRRLHREGVVLPGVPTDIAFAAGVGNDAQVAIISSSNGNVFFVDATTGDGEISHRLRTTTESESTDTRGVLSPALSTVGVTAAGREPAQLEFENPNSYRESLSLGGDRRPEYANFGEFEFIRDDNSDILSWYGVTLTTERDVLLPNETWTVTANGPVISRTEAATLALDGGAFVALDRPFCEAGVEVGDWLVVYGTTCGDAVAWPVTAVTAAALEVDGASGKLMDTLVLDDRGDIRSVSLGSLASAPTPETCAADQALRYAVMTGPSTWLVRGVVSGALHPWVEDPATGACVLGEDDTYVNRARELTLKAGAELTRCPPSNEQMAELFEGERFQNHAIGFEIMPGCERDLDTGDIRVVASTWLTRWELPTRSGRIVDGLSTDKGAFYGLGLPRGLTTDDSTGRAYLVDPGLNRLIEFVPTTTTVTKALD
ncbi:MAG: hypothetical protein IV100_08535 [Myxococcales bacterium]|nr:hypothetical protein [Myxococcales bacterium]